ncbi:hypothetical protein [Actinoplanes rectilineatus]|uniref:hypothetical protein n=1 Tax=Actinoplanes rectilineatus TaxID=113571 RepID=UPI000A9B2E0C|nr:hypothetical protein [Actinoplanes rectilineatus]
MHGKPDAPTEVMTLTAPPPRPRRVARWLVAGVVAAALGGGTAVVVTRGRAGAEAVPQPTVPAATAALERRDLSTTRSMPGSLGYGVSRPLSGHREATVTWLPEAGRTVRRGKPVYRADDQPVVLFYGRMPLFREISGENLVGRDVRIVADNLRALGYATGVQPQPGSTVAAGTPGAAPAQVRKGDGVLTRELIAAIKRWQLDVGLPVTGTIRVGDVEVQSGAIRVDAVAAQPGSPSNTTLMTVTSTGKLITVPAELGEATGITAGAAVTVVLPDESTVPAKVLSVGRALVADESTVTGPAKLTVTVTANDPDDVAALDSADVQVRFAGRTAKNVLAAPVEALVALTEGGYAVQAPTGLVAVTTGMFAGGWVEIEGPGLAEGTTVVVSS